MKKLTILIVLLFAGLQVAFSQTETIINANEGANFSAPNDSLDYSEQMVDEIHYKILII